MVPVWAKSCQVSDEEHPPALWAAPPPFIQPPKKNNEPAVSPLFYVANCAL